MGGMNMGGMNMGGMNMGGMNMGGMNMGGMNMGAQTMNRSVPMGGQPVTASAAADPIAEIQRFKALMDQGIITEADFEAKKRQLLGL
ncbi:MAG: SHOCT domain-containing protein [Clostridia bacterium]|nr:SHOCT domain-containing protein [Clostridia bacterium]